MNLQNLQTQPKNINSAFSKYRMMLDYLIGGIVGGISGIAILFAVILLGDKLIEKIRGKPPTPHLEIEEYLDRDGRIRRRLLPRISQQYDEKKELEEERLRLIDEKKKNFIGGPWRFYYIDQDGLDSLYNQISPVMKTTEAEIEESAEKSKSVKGKIPLFEPSIAVKGSEKRKERLEASDNPEIKYNQVFSHLIEKKLIIFGIEEFIFNKEIENRFANTLESIEQYYKFKSPSQKDYKEEFINFNRKQQVNYKLDEVKRAVGKYVCLQGVFVIENITGEGFNLKYRHPMSDILEKDMIITSYCANSCMTRFGNETFTRLERINARVFGTITDFNEEEMSIDIEPISIH